MLMNYIVVVTRSNHFNKNYTRVNRIRFNIHVGCTCILGHEEVVSFIHTSLWMFLYDSWQCNGEIVRVDPGCEYCYIYIFLIR